MLVALSALFDEFEMKESRERIKKKCRYRFSSLISANMSVGFGRGGKKIAHLGQDDRFVAIGERRRRRRKRE